MLNKYAFIDRDGTIIFEPLDTQQIDSLEKLQILDGVVFSLKQLIDDDYRLIMISNQDGLGTTSFPQPDFDTVQDKLINDLGQFGIKFYKIFICPHFSDDNCNCRKPKTGLVNKFIIEEQFDREKSFVVGDRESDKQFANNLGIRFYQTQTNTNFPRIITYERTTTETNIFSMCNLDGRGNYNIDTGIKFFDHMLEQLAKNSLIDLTLKCQSDLSTDEHHTIEDVGLALGTMICKALSEKKGLRRYGYILPMDEALAEVAIDLSGRPRLVWKAKFKRERIGDMSTELLEEFFHAFTSTLRATLHINLRYGKNEHHMAEAIFKATGRALRQAIERDLRQENIIPSTKGIL